MSSPRATPAPPTPPPIAIERRRAAAAVKLLRDLTRTMRARMKQIEAAEIREREGRPARVNIDEVLVTTLADVQAGTERLRKLAPFLVGPAEQAHAEQEALEKKRKGRRVVPLDAAPPALPRASVNREEIVALRRLHRTLKRGQAGQAEPAAEIAAMMVQLDAFEESYQRAEVWSSLSSVLEGFVATVSAWDQFSRRRVEVLLRGRGAVGASPPSLSRARVPRPKRR